MAVKKIWSQGAWKSCPVPVLDKNQGPVHHCLPDTLVGLVDLFLGGRRHYNGVVGWGGVESLGSDVLYMDLVPQIVPMGILRKMHMIKAELGIFHNQTPEMLQIPTPQYKSSAWEPSPDLPMLPTMLPTIYDPTTINSISTRKKAALASKAEAEKFGT
ncbi:hypothetical protein SERLA73DRAFT_149104 [Serpula lacrymans var. lacrymans S7.3]|uniref:Uncharacterized protein n=1 Tax=Serpula lacrymans var. lacrymans (strain S7.3) TaxID=936435 RepID=F8PF22_SERL3|nr:hypothetical protein SERLA73DRAFT_149104 [Serpula lacrymans var. lacrymans S7.3]